MITAGLVESVLVFWGRIEMPITISPFYLGLVMAMGFELSRDVLRAAQLSSELRESEGRMKLAAAAAGLTVWRWDIAPDSIWVSADGRALYGVPPGETITLGRFLETVHPEDREGVRAAVARSLSEEGGYQAEYRVVPPDATVRRISARGRVEFKGGPRMRQLPGVSLDITERKQAEAEAERQRGELAHLARVTSLERFVRLTPREREVMATSWPTGPTSGSPPSSAPSSRRSRSVAAG